MANISNGESGLSVRNKLNDVIDKIEGTTDINNAINIDGALSTDTSLNIASSTTVTGILDEDNMASNSATKLATQQSIKAYVDAQVGTVDTLAEVLGNGNTTGGNDILFGDNDKAIFGAGSDLQIWHDGSNSFIRDAGTGNLVIRGTNLNLQKDGGESYITMVADGAVSLFYDNAPKLATTSTGIDVTGTVTADGLTVDGNTLFNVDTGGYLAVSGNEGQDAKLVIQSDQGDNSQDITTLIQKEGGDFTIATQNGVDRINIGATTGDISFYEDTGTTAKFFWDADAESLGIGTTDTSSNNGSYGLLRIGSGGTLQGYSPTNNSNVFLAENAVINSAGNWEYLRNDLATNYRQGDGVHSWSYASSGSDGATITFAEAMRIDSSGNVGIGTDSPSRQLHLASSVPSIRLEDTDVSGLYAEVVQLATGDLSFRADHGNVQASSSISFSVDTTEHMRIDSSGNVLIKTASHTPTDTELVVSSEYSASGTTDAGITLSSRQGGNWRNSGIFANGDALTFTTGDTGVNGAISTSEKMRIDSSGNMLVGKTTSNSIADDGIQLSESGQLISTNSLATANSGQVAIFNRKTTDGDILDLRKDGATVGSIGVNNSRIAIYSTNGGIHIASGILPSDNAGARSDNAVDIGNINYRFKDLYLSGGVIGTAGARIYDSETSGSGLILSTGVIYPSGNTGATANGQVDLGSAGVNFKDLYLSGGVYLGGTGAANKLDDYEEGTWTITDGSGAGLSFTVQDNVYTKAGRLVVASAIITWPSTSNTSAARIVLPFTSIANNSHSGGVVTEQNWNTSITLTASCNYTDGVIFRQRGGSVLTNANLSGKKLRFTITYHAA
jgi:hypothetical protein